jgi:EPS-associated MarR family transcriptional regulator
MNNKADVFNSEKTLNLLQELERNPKVTQRLLAQKLEISLGKINFLITSLIGKGLVEVKNFKNSSNKVSYMYLLTPNGIKTKIRLTQEFFALKMQEYEKLKQEMEFLKKEPSF